VEDRFVGGEARIRTKIEATFVSVQTAFFGDVVRGDLADRHLICMSHMERAGISAAFDQRDDGTLVRWTRFGAFRVLND
jgi:hypothetical protein